MRHTWAEEIDKELLDGFGMTAYEYIQEYAPARVRHFVDIYAGNATRAALRVGFGLDPAEEGEIDVEALTYADRPYRLAATRASLLMAYPVVQLAIRERGETTTKKMHIADRNERMAMWTETMFDPDQPMKERLKASELLGKANCDFSEKKVLEGGDKPVKWEFIWEEEADDD